MNVRRTVGIRFLVIGLLLAAMLAALIPVYAQGGVTVRVGNNLRLRATASTSARVLATVPINTTLTALAISPDRNWIQTTFNGQTGWLALRYLVVESGSLADLPVVEGTTTAPTTGGGTTGGGTGTGGTTAGTGLRGVFLAIDGTTSQHGWHNFVPAESRAATFAGARMIAYIREEFITIETCSYTGNHFLNRIRVNYHIRLEDPVTHQTLGDNTYGRDPDGCPNERRFGGQTESVEARPSFGETWGWILENLARLGG